MRAPRCAPWCAALLVLGAAACGKKGPPQPPVPRGPLPPQQVAVRQLGEVVQLAWTLPEPRGPREGQRLGWAEVLRVEYPPGVVPSPDPRVFRRRGRRVGAMALEGRPAGSRVVYTDASWRELPDGGVGWTLRYGVRLRDLRGRLSPLVVAPDLGTLKPAPPPRQLRAEALAEGVRLEWLPPEGLGSARYRVYRARDGEPFPEAPLHEAPLRETEFMDRGVQVGERYRYQVRVALSDAPPWREGVPSETVSVVAEDRFPPGKPRGLLAVQEGLAVRLFWDPNPERDLAGYEVYRRAPGGSWRRLTDQPLTETSYLDREVAPGERWQYAVRAVDRAHPPNRSAWSDPVEITVQREPVEPGEP